MDAGLEMGDESIVGYMCLYEDADEDADANADADAEVLGVGKDKTS